MKGLCGMNLPKTVFGAMVLTAIWMSPSYGESGLGSINACILENIDGGEKPASCIDAAHDDCVQVPEGTPSVASVCFRAAKDRWGAGIKALMEKVTAQASGDVAVIAGIETKYDILAGLTQCDRLEELALAVSGRPHEVVLRQKSQCVSTAFGLAYARLVWRTRDLED